MQEIFKLFDMLSSLFFAILIIGGITSWLILGIFKLIDYVKSKKGKNDTTDVRS